MDGNGRDDMSAAGPACGCGRTASASIAAPAAAPAPLAAPVEAAAYAARARVFKALGHPARLAMLDALRHGERCVCELRALVDLDLSTVSKHLTLLKNAGVVACRRQGTQVHYRLILTCLPGFLECVDHFLRQDHRRRGEALADADR